MKIVLLEPQIPQNTGNIIRTCSVTGVPLVVIKPHFDMSDKALKRAGLDYHDKVDIKVYDSFDQLLEEGFNKIYFLSSKGEKIYTDISFSAGDLLIFGSESNGVAQDLWNQYPENFFRIPMIEDVRCLNLATSVGIVVYEALRQQKFPRLLLS